MIMQSQYMLAPTLHPHRGLRLPVTLYAGDVPDAWRHALAAWPAVRRARVAVLDSQGLRRADAAAVPRAGTDPPGKGCVGDGIRPAARNEAEACSLGACAGRLQDPAALRAAVALCAAQEGLDALWLQLPPDADPAEWAAWFDTAPGGSEPGSEGGWSAPAAEPEPGLGPDAGGADLCCLVAVVACLNARHLAGEWARDTVPTVRLAQVEFATRIVLLGEGGLGAEARAALRTRLQAWNPVTPVETAFSAWEFPGEAAAPGAGPALADAGAGAPSRGQAPRTAGPTACAPCTGLGLSACPPGARVLPRLQPAGLDLDAVAARAGWAHVLERRAWPAGAGAAALRSGCFESRDPFHPQRLLGLLSRPWPGLLRLQGWVWLASRPDWVVVISGHGRLLSVEPAGRWWAALPVASWPREAAARQALRARMVEPWGDRCQRIACIGDERFDPAALNAALQACQLRYDDSHAEIVAWRGLRDPLPPWHAAPDEAEAEAQAGPGLRRCMR